MKRDNLEQIQDEFSFFMSRAESSLKEDYNKYKRYVAEKTPYDNVLYVLTYPAFCFGMYVATCNDIEMDEQINDLLK
jgi:hypothetical protein